MMDNVGRVKTCLDSLGQSVSLKELVFVSSEIYSSLGTCLQELFSTL